MAQYKDKGVTDRAVDIFLSLVSAKKPRIGATLTRHRRIIFNTVLLNIRLVGIHEYARQTIAGGSQELLQEIRDGSDQ